MFSYINIRILSVKGFFCHYFYILNHSYNMAEAEAEVAVAEPEKSHTLPTVVNGRISIQH